jgi:multidrug efflux system membrane fusion protein
MLRSSDAQRAAALTVVRDLAALSLAALLGGCHQSDTQAPLPVAVVAVGVQARAAGEIGTPLRYPVEVAARYSNAMSFRVGGQLIERRLRLGDAVRKGEVVARLDPLDAEKQAAGARAVLQGAESRLRFAKQQIERDQAQASQELIAQSQLEQTQDAYSAALAARAQAVEQLALALNALHYNSLVAEHNGVITSENADTGQVVSPGQPVYGLAWSDETDLILDAAPSDLLLLTVGQAAGVTFSALPERRFEARVREISPAADPQSRTYRVKLTLADPGPDVHLGMTGEAVIARVSSPGAGGATRGVFEIPATAVFHQGEHAAVWTIRSSDSMLELRPVNLLGYGERTAYVDRGLLDGDHIVAAGVHTVYAGEHVMSVKPLFAGDAGDEAQKTAAVPRAASIAP